MYANLETHLGVMGSQEGVQNVTRGVRCITRVRGDLPDAVGKVLTWVTLDMRRMLSPEPHGAAGTR